tara:strand:+ start:952 stop:1173 length:222 start_codon:yes stop_codon:yes gene_type:complete
MKRLSVAMALALASFCAQGEPEVDCGPMGDCVIATETDETSAGYVATLNAIEDTQMNSSSIDIQRFPRSLFEN